jgi:hypothetical protein
VVVHLPRDVDATTVLSSLPHRPDDPRATADLGWREAGGVVGAGPGAALPDRPTVTLTRPVSAAPEPPTVPTRRPVPPPPEPLEPALTAAAPVLRSVPQDSPYERPYEPPYADRYGAGQAQLSERPYDQPYDHAYDPDPDDDGPYDTPGGPEPDGDLEPWDDEPLSPARSAQVVATAGAALAVVATGAWSLPC